MKTTPDANSLGEFESGRPFYLSQLLRSHLLKIKLGALPALYDHAEGGTLAGSARLARPSRYGAVAVASATCGTEFCFEETTMEWMQIALTDPAGPVGARR